MSVGSFLWGSGGRRMTPEDITRERALAARQMQVDYSPIASPWQGLARVSENLIGGLSDRRASRASEANATDNQRIIEALMNPRGDMSAHGATGGVGQMGTVAQPATAPMQDTASSASPVAEALTGMPTTDQIGAAATLPSGPPLAPPQSTAVPAQPAINPAIIQALTSPYVSDEVRQLATLQYRQQLEAQNRRPNEPPEIVQLMQLAHIDPASPQGQAMLAQAVQGRVDPVVSIPYPGGLYTGPRSGAEAAIAAATGRAAPTPQTIPITTPGWAPDQGGPTQPASGNFP